MSSDSWPGWVRRGHGFSDVAPSGLRRLRRPAASNAGRGRDGSKVRDHGRNSVAGPTQSGDHLDVSYEADAVDENGSSSDSSKRSRRIRACFAPAMVPGSWCSMAGAWRRSGGATRRCPVSQVDWAAGGASRDAHTRRDPLARVAVPPASFRAQLARDGLVSELPRSFGVKRIGLGGHTGNCSGPTAMMDGRGGRLPGRPRERRGRVGSHARARRDPIAVDDAEPGRAGIAEAERESHRPVVAPVQSGGHQLPVAIHIAHVHHLATWL